MHRSSSTHPQRDGSVPRASPIPPGTASATSLSSHSLPSPSVFADSLAKNSKLDPAQSRELHMLIKLSNGDVRPGQLLLSLSQHAMMFRLENLLQAILQKDDSATETLQDVQKILKGPACLAKGDKHLILKVVKDILVSPTITSYVTVDVRIKRRLMERKTELDIAHLFEHPAREQQLDTYIKQCCRSVRNQLRKIFVNAVKDNSNHADVALLVAKFREHSSLDMPSDFLGRVLIILSWARNNILIEDEEEEEEEEEDEDVGRESDAPPRKRKRATKKTGKGKTPRATAFWYRVDQHIADLLRKNGTRLSSPDWARYIADLISKERQATHRATVPTPAFTNTIGELSGTYDLSLFTSRSTPPPAQQPVPPPSRSPSPLVNESHHGTPPVTNAMNPVSDSINSRPGTSISVPPPRHSFAGSRPSESTIQSRAPSLEPANGIYNHRHYSPSFNDARPTLSRHPSPALSNIQHHQTIPYPSQFAAGRSPVPSQLNLYNDHRPASAVTGMGLSSNAIFSGTAPSGLVSAHDFAARSGAGGALSSRQHIPYNYTPSSY